MVIGGAFGIGLATARRFAAEGANVVIADLDDEQAESSTSPAPTRYCSALLRRTRHT